MASPAIPGVDVTPLKPTRAELHAWLEAEGLAHLARLNLEAAAPFVPAALWPRLHDVGAKRRLSDLGSAEGVSRAKDWLSDAQLAQALPSAVVQVIDQERQNVLLARSQLAARVAVPGDARTHALHARLLVLRAKFPESVAPRPDALLPRDALEVDGALPGWIFRDTLPSERPLRDGGGFAPARVRLAMGEVHPSVSCSCGATACVHQLAAIDTALLALREGLKPRSLEALTRPAWHRTLAALNSVFGGKSDETQPTDVSLEPSFRLLVDGQNVEVTAWLDDQRVGRDDFSRLRLPLLALLPERGAPASRALLEALVGTPRVVLAEQPSRSVRIERASAGLAAEDRLGSVRLTASLDGAPVPSVLAERMRLADDEEPLFLWDEGPCVLTLIDVHPRVKAALEVLHQEGASFPPEGQVALLESLSSWASQVPVAMPRSVLGETLPSARQLVVRLDARSGVDVEVELRVRPLPDAPALFPGTGPKDVHLRRGEKAVHAVRDLAAEKKAASELIDALRLPAPSPITEWMFHLEKIDDVFAVLERCAHHPSAPQLEWVSKPLRSLGATGPRALRVHLEEKSDWFDGLGELSVFGERVELARMVEALRRESRFVEVRSGDFVELNEALRTQLEGLAAHAVPGKRGLRFGPGVVEVLRSLQDAGALIDGDSAWKKLSARADAARKLDPRLPKQFRGELRPYQLDAFRWLMKLATLGAGGVLADDMGLGKTVQSLAVLSARAELGPALVIAPTSVAFNWADEAKRFAPGLRVLVYSDASDRTETLDQLKSGDVLVLSYGLLVRDAKQLAARRFATVIFDEAQQVKNSNTQRFHAARALRGDFKFALSGTPVENHLGELWTIFALVFPSLLGAWDGFRERFAMPIEKRVDPRAPAELARVLAPFLLRRTKSEVERELPARTEIRVPVTLSTAEWQLYEDTRFAALSDLETPKKKMKEEQRRVQVLAMLTRLRLAAAHPKLVDPASTLPSSKLERLLELLEELRTTGQRSLIFSQFTSHLALVEEALRARGVAYLSLDGSTPAAERKRLVETFQNGDAPVFLISVKAGGFGLNLTAATNVIHLDPWWNPAVEDQASDRAHRIGQRRAVTIYRLIASGTVEEKMLTLHARKRALVDQILSGQGKVATDELLALLS
ncbi:MAG: DEAD/DEAH box helicase [Archangium sp.]